MKKAGGAAWIIAAMMGISACSESADGDDSGGDGDGDAGDGDGDSSGTGGALGDGDMPGDGDAPSDGGTPGDGDVASDGGTTGDGDAPSDGGTTGDGDAPGVTEIPTIPEVPSSGCGTESPASGPLSMMVEGTERTYIISLPDGYDPMNPYPVIFAFHGLGGSGELVSNQWYFGIEQQGGTPTIFVYPDGLGDDGDTGWPNEGGRDVAFFDALLASLKTAYCIDENRVFSTGHSFGGMMTFTLACERAQDLRAIAPVAGARFGGQGGCSGPVAMLGIHGENDETVDYDQGLTAAQRILEENGCDETSTASTEPEEFCTSYACDSGYPSVWCKHQDGHNWPDFAAGSVKSFFDQF